MHSIVWFFTIGRFDPVWVQSVASVALVILTFVTLAVLVRYAWDTRTLAIASNKSAEAGVAGSKAALAQIQLMVDKERARIFVVPIQEAACMVVENSDDGTGRQKVMFFNVGPTPAINVVVRYNAIASTMETEPQRRNDAYTQASIPEVIAANSDEHSWLNINGVGSREPTIYIHLWGEVMYNDVISTEQRSTKFRFRLRMKRGQYGVLEFDGAWRQFGTNAEDNRAT
jgi:hypothetical protein